VAEGLKINILGLLATCMVGQNSNCSVSTNTELPITKRRKLFDLSLQNDQLDLNPSLISIKLG
jgi:hypothetical protein